MKNISALTMDQVKQVNGGIKIWVSRDTSTRTIKHDTATADADAEDNYPRIRIFF